MKITSTNFLVNNLIKEGYLKTPHLIETFRKIDRADFVPEEYKSEAYIDAPLPIGQGQTISQPLTVAFMFELLQPESGDTVLDVGYGSGWTTALLAEIVGEKGRVFAIERIPELCEFGKRNIEKYNFLALHRTGSGAGVEKGIVECVCADGTKGWDEKAPFDKILASASARKLPAAWKEQLKIEGRIVTPIEWSIWLFIKKGEDKFEKFEYPGFSFVPLISDANDAN